MKVSKIFVTVDVVLVRHKELAGEVLLIKRKNDPFRGQWALPGGFVDENEDLETAALRELQEETGIQLNRAQQIGAFGKPGRDPRHHTVSVAFFAEAPENVNAVAADDAAEADWFLLSDLPPLAFDHSDIIDEALKRFLS